MHKAKKRETSKGHFGQRTIKLEIGISFIIINHITDREHRMLRDNVSVVRILLNATKK